MPPGVVVKRWFWVYAFRCWVNRPAWRFDDLHREDGHLFPDGDVYRYCKNCNGFVRGGRHWDIFEEES